MQIIWHIVKNGALLCLICKNAVLKVLKNGLQLQFLTEKLGCSQKIIVICNQIKKTTYSPFNTKRL